MKTGSIQATVEQNTDRQVEKAISEQMASDKVQQQLAAASKGAQAVIQLKASLDAYNSFYLGLLAYTDGVSDASDGAAALLDGAGQLAAGAGDLKDGAGQLYDGLQTLSGQVPSLLDGIAALDDGAEQLKDGLTKFDEQGVQKTGWTPPVALTSWLVRSATSHRPPGSTVRIRGFPRPWTGRSPSCTAPKRSRHKK